MISNKINHKICNNIIWAKINITTIIFLNKKLYKIKIKTFNNNIIICNLSALLKDTLYVYNILTNLWDIMCNLPQELY